MGNEESTPANNDQEPQVLSSRDIPGVARYMQSDECKKIFVLAGAGISTSAGIPDFRSPGTGLYANLAKLNLPRAEAVFDINYFPTNPVPFYTLAKDMNPEQFRPTPTHSFFRLLHEKGLLGMCFTQNIDTLERRAGLPEPKIVEAHGSFASNSCIRCKAPFPMDKMKTAVETGEIAYCERSGCTGLVKPDIVFFGEGLPPSFFTNFRRLSEADLLFIFGTSLTVHPFASLASMVPVECPRVLINLEQVGDLGHRPDDVLALGKCDDIVRALCEELGWTEDLDRLWAETEPMGVKKEKDAAKDDDVEKKIDQITKDMDRSLKITDAVRGVVRKRASEPAISTTGISKIQVEHDDQAPTVGAEAAPPVAEPSETHDIAASSVAGEPVDDPKPQVRETTQPGERAQITEDAKDAPIAAVAPDDTTKPLQSPM